MTQYFSISDFDQHDLPGSGSKMDDSFLVHLNELRHRCDFAFIIKSGYRSPEYNKQISSTGENGPHTTGKAVDIRCTAAQAYIIVREAIAMRVFTGIGVAQAGSKRFVHLDTLTAKEGYPRPVMWSY